MSLLRAINWPEKRLKYLASYNDEVLSETTDEFAELDYVEIADVSLSGGVERSTRLQFHEAPSRARRKVRDGDVLISTVRTYLKAIASIPHATENMIASTGFCVVRPGETVDSAFIGWTAKSDRFVHEVVSRSVGVSYPAINASEIGNIEIPLPPLETQKRIAAFLDEKTAQIDGLIARKQALLARLAEKRQALITRAVTKGLNPAAALKDSGIDWLGQIPAHWEIKKASWFFSVEKGKDAQKYTKEFCGSNPGDIPVYSGQTENEGILGHTDHHLYDVGDVGCLFSTTVGAKAMSLRHLKGKFCLSQNCMVIYPHAQVCVPFYYYHLQAVFSFERGLIPSHMQPSFRVDDFYRFRIALPPSDEQVQISDWLEQQCSHITQVVAKAEHSIYFLNEYRSALITSAVTGKLVI